MSVQSGGGSDPIDELKKSAETIKATVEAIKAVEDLLDSPRSVVCEVDNTTGRTLQHEGDRHDSGGFQNPPAFSIPPKTNSLFSSKSTGFATGTKGEVRYHLDNEGTLLVVEWDNPFAGINSCDIRVDGIHADSFVIDHICGSGNHGAFMRYLVGETPPAPPPPLRKIGFNPQDRFMVTLGNTLVVVTQSGDVFGADVSGGDMGPVFQFTGAKIGFNPQDRFMVTMGNTLVVVTQSGAVFGADVSGRDIRPVFQFTGSKVGFNPQDRFMMTVDNTLIVVTQNGSVFGAKVSPERDIGPIFQFTGAAIGFNPEDRFMATVGPTLVVTTQNGSVFASNAIIQPTPVFKGTTIGGQGVGQIFRAELTPVVQFGGAQVAFNPQDRFLVTLGGTLVVITRAGDVFGHDVVGQDISPARQLNP